MLCEHGGRSVRVRALPIGIPFEHFESLARSAPLNSISTEDIKIILGVDRLDYTKGENEIFLGTLSVLKKSFATRLSHLTSLNHKSVISRRRNTLSIALARFR